MFHDLSTFRVIYQQFTHFNGLFQVFLSKKLFLCTRETSYKPKAMDACIKLVRRRRCYPNIFKPSAIDCKPLAIRWHSANSLLDLFWLKE